MLKKLAGLGLALVMGLSTLTFQPAPAEARRGGAIIGGLIAGAVIGGLLYSRHRHRHYYDYGYSYAPAYAYSYRPSYRWGHRHRHNRYCRH